MQVVKARENMKPVKARENVQKVKARENIQLVKARENMQPVKARENEHLALVKHTSTATNKIKRSNGIYYPAQKTFESETFKFVFLKWQPKQEKHSSCFTKSAMKPVYMARFSYQNSI